MADLSGSQGLPPLDDELYGVEIDDREEPSDLATDNLGVPLEAPTPITEAPLAQVKGAEPFDPALLESIKKDLEDETKWPGVPPELLAQVRSDFGVGASKESIEAKGRQEWAEQNPKAAKLQEAADVAQSIFGHTFGLAGKMAAGAEEFRDSLPLAGRIALGEGSVSDIGLKAVTKTGEAIESGLGKLSSFADSLRTKPSSVHEPLTNIATGIDAGVETARLINPIPASTEQAATGLATMGVLGAMGGPAQKAGISGLKTAGNIFEKVSAYLPGASVVRDAFLAGKRSVRDNAALRTRVTDIGREMDNLKDLIVQKETEHAGFIPDAIEYGQLAKKGLDFQEEMARAPLASRSTALKNRRSMQTKYSVDEIIQKAEAVRDDLTGVIATSQDAGVNKIVGQYLDKNIPESGGIGGSGWELKDGNLFKVAPPEFTLSDLLKDRGRLGKAYMRHKTKGVLTNEQTTAILKLQNILDDFIEKKLTEQPWHWGEKEVSRWEQGVAVKEKMPTIEKRVGYDAEALAEVRLLRSDWHQFYKRFASDTAVAIKKNKASEILNSIGKNASAVEEARQLLPTYTFEKLADHEASLLIRDMKGAKSPLAFLEKKLTDNPGYYERLLGKDQVNSLRVLAKNNIDYAGLKTEMENLGERINKSMSFAKRKRDLELFSNLRREGERAKIMTSLGAGAASVGTGLLMLKSMPVVAGSLVALGIAPGAFALAYYAGNRALRAAAENALRNSMRLGKAVSQKDKALLMGMAAQGGKQNEEPKR